MKRKGNVRTVKTTFLFGKREAFMINRIWNA